MLIAETDVILGANPYVEDGARLAHIAYRYEAAPIILHTLLSGSADALRAWCASLPSGAAASAAFNFLSTHDGVYLRPKEPPLPDAAISMLAQRARMAGGIVTMREAAGAIRPYELDVTIADLLDLGDGQLPERLFCAFALAFHLPGVPMIYLGTLLGLRNDRDAVARTGDPRSIGRRRTTLAQAHETLDDPGMGQMIRRVCRLLVARRESDAFALGAPLTALPGPPGLIVLERTGATQRARLHLVLGRESTRVDLPPGARDMLTGAPLDASCELAPLAPVITLEDLR